MILILAAGIAFSVLEPHDAAERNAAPVTPHASGAIRPRATAPDSLAALLGTGISRDLANWRAERVSNVSYDLQLDVTSRDSALGRVTAEFTRRGSDDVILDFRGRHLTSVSVGGEDVSAFVSYNGSHIHIPASLVKGGRASVSVSFVADIGAAGASIIRYTDPADDADYLYTLLVPADANQLFPCFDQPDLKARVKLSLVMPSSWTAVSNGALADTDRAGERATVRFAETKPISTYLIAFAAGPWTRLDAPRGTRAMSMYVRRSRASEVESDSLFALNAKALDWLERWFDSPYPFGKYDFVLAPAFPFGGMEHPGAVFYSEDRFVFRERPTQPQRIARASVVYHEAAHMWFGDLVTMRWFDDLWLKEGFATYMAARVQEALDHGTNPWQSFWIRNKPPAYAVDVTDGTTAVWQELSNLDQAKSNYGPIVYNKAPGILRQLEYLVGEQDFQRGVRAFLKTHAFGNANWGDLLEAIGKASGRRLDYWGTQYMLRRGMPVLEPSLVVSPGGARLSITQRPARETVSGDGAWPMRLEVAIGRADGSVSFQELDLEGAAATIPLRAGTAAPAFAFVNANDRAYALAMLDDRTRAWMLDGGLPRVKDDFLRAMLWGALWDEVRDARLAPSDWVTAVLSYLGRESDEQLVSTTLGRLTRAVTTYLDDASRDALEPRLRHVLRAGMDDSTKSYGVRRAYLNAHVRTARTPEALAAIDSLLEADSVAGGALLAPTRWDIVNRLVEMNASRWRTRLEAEAARDTTSDGRRREFVARAGQAASGVKQQYFERYLRDSTLNEDWATASLGAFNSPGQSELTFPYLTRALDALPYIQRNRRIFFLGAWLDAFLGGQSSPEAFETVQAWLQAQPGLPVDLRRKVQQAADELERTVLIRSTWPTSRDG